MDGLPPLARSPGDDSDLGADSARCAGGDRDSQMRQRSRKSPDPKCPMKGRALPTDVARLPVHMTARMKRTAGGPSAGHTVSRLRHSPFALAGGKAPVPERVPAVPTHDRIETDASVRTPGREAARQ